MSTKATRIAALTAAAAILLGSASSAGAFSFRAPKRGSVAGQSSTVGSSGGYARAFVTYARASVTLPTQQLPSSTVGAAAPKATKAAAQAPVVVVKRATGSATPVVKIDVPEKVEAPNVADVQPLSTAAIEQVETQLIDLPVPPVTGIAAKAAVLAFLQFIETGSMTTLTASETLSLAALDYSRRQVIAAFGDADTPEKAAMLAKIDAARAEVVLKFADAKTILPAKFAEARAAVLAMDPAELEEHAAEIVALLTEAQLVIAEKLAEAQAAMAAAMALFV